ncbi:MAG: TorF family putative porin [Novosphingobium sp.]|uniref:TorF family putative porin n=1 Tax=Novosphingobium sp. TaxID=1874826 RepID=UPI003015C471
MKFRLATMALMTAVSTLAATAAHAEETAPPPAITVSGNVALVSDYRFRGVSQSNGGAALQGGITISHESGAYAGFWSSNLAGWGTFGGPNLELDLIAGYKFPVASGAALDVGLTWYTYPGGASKTAFAEPYVKLSGTVGPASLTAGVAYAPKQQALGRWYNTGASAAAGVYDNPGDKKDNLYIWTDAAAGIPSTPVTLKGHIGYSKGNSGLGPNGTSVAPTGKYIDWLLGADVAVGRVTLGIAYVDTDISKAESAYLYPNFSSTKDGSSIAGSKAVFSISASF